MTGSNRCTKCGETKPVSEFYRHISHKNGLSNQCKICVRSEQRTYYAGHKEAVAEYGRSRREDATYRQSRRTYMSTYGPAYYERHKDRIREEHHSWQASHRESVAERNRIARRTERGRALGIACWHRYKGRKEGALGYDYTTAEMIAARCEMWGGRCYVCGGPMQAIDHVKPISKGGAHLPCNLRPICKSCNSSKNARWPYALSGSAAT
ncbi:MAG TPA: hypothetical protein DCP69_04205 [Candidatus Omnitrophica bacterium]|nr:hypothetical protein [Candidatus Omnitrophota bacterium]